jgi:O-acetyl-ADP-ribose deacetylase (regulator of RNase III)
MLVFKSGNIMNSKCFALVNTVNTVGVMGKGIALQFKNEFPHNFVVFRASCIGQKIKIGKLLVVKHASLLMGERLIINFPTKTNWRFGAEYTYIEQGLISLAQLIEAKQIVSIAIPALGCGNGGLNWDKVRLLIIQHLGAQNSVIEIYEPSD